MQFSVVTPSLNQAEFLPETLASVRRAAECAREHEVEHIVADAGSTDGSVSVLEAQTFARWWSRPDAGQAAAVNEGWASSSGEVLSFLCSDDLWEPDTVSLVAEAFERNPGVDVVYGDFFFLEGCSGWKRRKVAGEFSLARLRRDNFISQPATFIRRRVFEKFGPLDASLRYCMDYEYWLRIASRTTWLYLPLPLAVMRQHAASKTNAHLAAAWRETAEMARKHGGSRCLIWRAWRMQWGGQFYYGLKRRLFQWLGRWAS